MKQQPFFIDGPGGTGKTYLYRAILVAIRSKKLIALAMALSRVVAVILPGGQTTHSIFKFPLQIENNISRNISKQSGLTELLQVRKIIISDKAAMINKHAIEVLDYMLQYINECDLPFGGKIIVLGGDFCQVLPVISRARK